MDVNSVKSVSPNNTLFKKMMAIVLSVMVFIIAFVVIINANNAAKDTVAVLRVKNADGLVADKAVAESDIEVYDIIRREYTEDMFLAEEKEAIIGKYTNYYLRKGSVLHKDQITEEDAVKNEWLYEMPEAMEAVTVPYDYIECGGDILTPGDRIRVRAVYEGTDNYVSYGDNPYAAYSASNGEMKTQVVFDSIVVRDLLNSDSHSIYEIYKEVAKLPEDRKQAVMKTDDFIKSILPKALILEASPQQVNTYSLMKGNDAALVITILSRSGSSIVLDDLSTLQSEVETWIEKNQ